RIDRLCAHRREVSAMTSCLRFRFSSALVLLVLAGLGVTQSASATPPSAAGPFPLASVPECLATAQDTGGARICQVRQAFPGTPWQAATGEWIVVRNTAGSASQATCLATQGSVVATFARRRADPRRTDPVRRDGGSL